MKHLLLFSLKRRFLNKMMIYFIVIMSVLMLLIGFVDKIVLTFNPDFSENISIKLENFDQQLFVEVVDYPFTFDEFSRIRITENLDHYIIKSPDALEEPVKEQIRHSIAKYHYQKTLNALDTDKLEALSRLTDVKIIDDFIDTEDTSQKHHVAFYGITVIYFMMISFAAMIAQEIIAEKQSNILELIGTSVPLEIHYYSKILGGWLSVLIQVGILTLIVSLVLLLRIGFDNGRDWIKFIENLNLYRFEFSNITEGLSIIFSNSKYLGVILLSFVYLFLGILTLQIFLVRLTLKVKNIEEAASIQSPIYIVLLFLYYGAMFLNNPSSMQKGLAMVLSWFPFFSMIFMPARILLYSVGSFQLLISLSFSLICFVYILTNTRDLYKTHILVGFQD